MDRHARSRNIGQMIFYLHASIHKTYTLCGKMSMTDESKVEHCKQFVACIVVCVCVFFFQCDKCIYDKNLLYNNKNEIKKKNSASGHVYNNDYRGESQSPCIVVYSI